MTRVAGQRTHRRLIGAGHKNGGPWTAFWAAVITYAVLVFLTLLLPHWPIGGLAIVVLIGGILSLVPVTLLWLARRIVRMMRATFAAPHP